MPLSNPREIDIDNCDICHITLSFGGGLQQALESLANERVPGNHTIVTFGKRDKFHNLTQRPLPESRIRDVFFADIVVVHSTKAGFLRPILKLAGKRIAYMPHSFHFSQSHLPSNVRFFSGFVERVLSLFTDHYLLLGWHEVKQLRSIHVSKPFSLVRNFATAESQQDLPLHQHIAKTKPYVILCGRIHPQKNPNRALELVPTLIERGYDVVWIGGGDSDWTLRLQNAGVHVTGWTSRTNVVRYMGNASFILHTASAEGLPYVFVEAWKYCGSRIVCYREDYAWFLPKKYKFSSRHTFESILSAIEHGSDYFDALQRIFGARFNTDLTIAYWRRSIERILS